MNVNLVCPHCLKVHSLEKQMSYTAEHCQSCEASLLDTKPLNANLAIVEYFIKTSDLPVVVDFWAPWCGPCISMAPHFETTARTLSLQAQFLKVNNDDAQGQDSNIVITNIPAVLVFKNGKEIDRFTGLRSSKQIIKWLEKHI
ncbi:MAG: Thioredoxin [uncultured Sulfurovum sp.]|uniref:Thioredoxin n=1 Tax=uncultured Sulfurovum sp. TaxID=269237 RepID=A0A6S6UHW2_9BACT|nr:MAG: Thioredoxin [uncultured Sulfurovum sp.]